MIVTVTPNPGLDRTLTVSRITFDEMIRASGSRLDWGGKGFNVSRALHALGAKSVVTGFVGGPTGQMLSRGLEGMGISTDLLPIAGETRTNTVVTEAGSGRYVKVNEPGPTVQPPSVVRENPITAFVNVTLVPMTEEQILPNQTVLVKGARIAAIGSSDSVAAPPGATVIDGQGRGDAEKNGLEMPVIG